MKLLVAHAGAQNPNRRPRPDFHFAEDGELVYAGVVCDRDAADPDAPTACGCGRAFSGLVSGRSTTTAIVRDIDITEQQLHDAVHASQDRAGWLDLLGSDDEKRALVQGYVDELRALAADAEVGTVVRRRVDDVYADAGAPIPGGTDKPGSGA